MRSRKSRQPDIAPDPFLERVRPGHCTSAHVLGGRFEFECASSELQELVEAAYADLPRHRLSAGVPRFRVSIALAPPVPATNRGDAPHIGTLSGGGLFCGTTASSDVAVVCPESRSALVILSPNLLSFPYHARYELIEFAVFTLAARVLRLVPLHAACVGRRGGGLLLIGESGAGKSTVSLHCLLRGLDFVSEDSVFVTPHTLRATGVANFLHLRCDSIHSAPPATQLAIRSSPVIRRRSGVEKFEIDLRATDFRLASKPLQVCGLVFISAATASDGSLLTPLRSREVRERLARSQPYAANQAGWSTFLRRVGAIPAFELRRGRHPAEAGEALQQLLVGAARRKR
jgi:hypothetical protein